MSKKSLTRAIVGGILLLLTICLVLNFYYDEVDVIPKQIPFRTPDGKEEIYQLPAYAQHYKYHKFGSELCYTLATALIVFLIVDRAFHSYDQKQERKERDENLEKVNKLQETINKNVFEGVLKMLMPKELFEILVSDIITKEVIRRNTRWEYTIHATDIGYSMVQHISFDLENMGNTDKNIEMSTSVTHNKVTDSYFEYYKVEKNGTTITTKTKEEIEKENIDKTENSIERSTPILLEAKQTVKVSHQLRIDYKTKNIVDCHWSRYSIVGLTIRINKPPDCKFILAGTFSEPLQIEREDSTTILYKPIKGILLGQSVYYIIEPIQLLSEG